MRTAGLLGVQTGLSPAQRGAVGASGVPQAYDGGPLVGDQGVSEPVLGVLVVLGALPASRRQAGQLRLVRVPHPCDDVGGGVEPRGVRVDGQSDGGRRALQQRPLVLLLEGVMSFLEKRPPVFPDQVTDGMPAFFPWWDEPGFH